MRPTSAADVPLERIARRERPFRVPRPLEELGLYVVDGSWGTIQPIAIAPEVRTVGELEVIEHIRDGGTLIDTRSPQAHAQTTIPTAINVPHGEVTSGGATLDGTRPAVLFCNGPLCSATPSAIRALLDAGHTADSILYYRGGLRDWITTGLPVTGAGDRST